MKKNVFKTMVAAACVVAAVMGGMKAYNAKNFSEADLLLAENVEALSARESIEIHICYPSPGSICIVGFNGTQYEIWRNYINYI